MTSLDASVRKTAEARAHGPGGRPGSSVAAVRAARTGVPAAPRLAVRRPVLDALLDEAANRPLTLVSAGPGWGKTTAVSLWASRRPTGSVAWLTLDVTHNSSAAFWSDVLDALRAAVVDPVPGLAELRTPTQASPSFLHRVHRVLDQIGTPLTLVLDDFHVVTNDDVLADVENLLAHAMPLRVVVLTRFDPPLPLHRLRVADEMAEVVADDLAFDAPAVAALAAAEGVALSAHEMTHLVEETEGWAVGIRLRLMSLAHGQGRDGSAARSTADYLVAEVLHRQPPEVRDLLLLTSVTTPLCQELAEAVAPGADAAGRELQQLADANDFVTVVGPDRRWYRLHPLLREVLQVQLRLQDPGAYRAAHGRAAEWLARHGAPARALEHALAAEDWELFGRLFADSAAPLLVEPERGLVLSMLERVPFADLPPSPALEACAAALAVTTGHFEAGRSHVRRARAMLGTGRGDLLLRALVELVDASAARGVGDVPSTATAGTAALALLAEVPWPSPTLDAYEALARTHRAVGLLWEGDSDAAELELRSMLGAAADGTPPTLAQLNGRAYLALADATACRLDDAEVAAQHVLADAEAWGWSSHLQVRVAYAAAALVQVQRGRDEEAERLLARGLAADVGGAEPASTLVVRAVQALTALGRGRPRTAEIALAEVDRIAAQTQMPPFAVALVRRARTEVALAGAATPVARPPAPDATSAERVCAARLLLRAGRTAEAAAVVANVASSDGDVETRVDAWLVLAAARASGARGGRSDDALEQALALAEPQGLVRPFVVARPDALVPVLRRVLQGRSDAFAEALLRDVPAADGGREPEPLLEPLTERELAVLAALPTMESNAEIAADLYVSVNTVKAHLKALYRKLGVTSRRAAAARGRDLGLIR